MQTFKSWKSYWNFAFSVKNDYRYIYSTDVVQFLKILLATSKNKVIQLNKDHVLFRSQRGYDEKNEYD